MSNKYHTGSYHIHLFDKHGTRKKTLDADSYISALKKGEKKIKKPPYASYSITRVLANSVDRAYPWSVRPEEILDD